VCLIKDDYFMIVCICNNVNSETISSAVDMGATTVQAVRKATRAASCCGKCQFKVHSLIQSHIVDSTQLLKQVATQA
jgi:bacterioferritin-associated ferredoxin